MACDAIVTFFLRSPGVKNNVVTRLKDEVGFSCYHCLIDFLLYILFPLLWVVDDTRSYPLTVPSL